MSASLKMFQTCCVCANRISINIERLFHLRGFSTSARLLSKKKDTNNTDAENSNDHVDPDLKSAAKSISKHVPGDKTKIGNDLISQLKKMQFKPTDKEETTKRQEYLSDVLSNMRVVRKRQDFGKSAYGFAAPRKVYRRSQLDQDYKLFQGKGLGIFSEEDVLKAQKKPVKETLWDVVKREELATLQAALPTNGFEEMIEWTKQGKIWKFPIDNEQDWESEKNTGFHEHIFLEHHTEGFPKRGPLRHFIDLVVVALSKNAFLTAQQKKDHIEWFRQYFIENKQILEDTLGEDGKVEPSDEQQLLESSAAS